MYLKIDTQANWDENYLAQVGRLTLVKFFTSYEQPPN